MSKQLDRLTLLNTFIRIAENGSISRAARDLGLSQPSVSRQLVELESRLKTQLIRRTTHSLALTESGAELLTDAKALLDNWERVEEKYLGGEQQVKGHIKVVAPVALGQIYLARIAANFLKKYPEITLSWILEDEPIRFAEIGCDCWIKIGSVPDTTLIVKQIGKVIRIVVGSTRLTKGQKFSTPQDALHLPLIALDPFEGKHIPLTYDSFTKMVFNPKVCMSTNNIFASKEAALMGLGVAVLPRWFIEREIAENKLIDILPKWQAPTLDIHLAYFPNRHQPKRLRFFLDFITEQLKLVDGIV